MVTASTSAPAGAQCLPASLPTAKTARPPSTGMTIVPPLTPLVQNPPASSIGNPATTAGTTACPCAKNPMLDRCSPGCDPPNAASDPGIGSDPCCASQYPVWKYAPGVLVAMTDVEFSVSCQPTKPLAISAVPSRPNHGIQPRSIALPGSSDGQWLGVRGRMLTVSAVASGAAMSSVGTGRKSPMSSSGRPVSSQEATSTAGTTVSLANTRPAAS